MIFDSHVHIDMGVGTGIGIGGTLENEEGSIIEAAAEKEISQFVALLRMRELGVLANAADTREYEVLSNIEGIRISFGIHPWSSDEFCGDLVEFVSAGGELVGSRRNIGKANGRQLAVSKLEDKIADLEMYFCKAHAVGEIGMDSVWCDCDLEYQRKLFIAQMNMAEKLKKPVVLHTKGQEKAIAEILRGYSVRKLVHWYSCEEHLEEFMKQDCYFTVGPDFKTGGVARLIMESVPLSRLLVETDGVSAVEWALNRKITPFEIPSFLRETIQAIADIKNVSFSEAERRIEENFYRFLGES